MLMVARRPVSRLHHEEDGERPARVLQVPSRIAAVREAEGALPTSSNSRRRSVGGQRGTPTHQFYLARLSWVVDQVDWRDRVVEVVLTLSEALPVDEAELPRNPLKSWARWFRSSWWSLLAPRPLPWLVWWSCRDTRSRSRCTGRLLDSRRDRSRSRLPT